MLLSGLLQAFGLVLLSVAFNLFLRFGTVNFNMEPITFTCVAIVTGSMVLTLFAGPGRLIGQALKNRTTWLYGVFSIAVFIFDVYLTQHVSATEMSLFSRMAIPVSFLISAFILHRQQAMRDISGVALVILGLGVLFYIQPVHSLKIVFLLALGTGIAQALEIISTEGHKQSVSAHQTGNMRDRARVIGFVSFTTSMMFLLMVLAGSLLRHFSFPEAESLAFFPAPAQLVHPESVWLGLFYGAFLSSAYRYFFWSSSYKLKADNVLALLAFVPLCTFAAEWFLVTFTPVDMEATSFTGEKGSMLLLSCIIITAGSGLSVFLRVRRDIVREHSGRVWTDIKRAITIDAGSIPAIAQAANSLDDYEIICATLEQTKGDKKAAATLLDIPRTTLQVLYKGKGRLALNDKYSQHIGRRFRTQVASRDALTDLLNRGGFMSRLRTELDRGEPGTLLYLDLDKFKPVNDTYGHETGDALLQKASERLTDNLPEGALISRMGGDEFCAYVPGTRKAEAQKTAANLSRAIAAPYKVKGLKSPIHISVSIGMASFPADGKTPETLIAKADKGMYGVKHSKE